MSRVTQAKSVKQWWVLYKEYLKEAAHNPPTPTPDGKGYPIQVGGAHKCRSRPHILRSHSSMTVAACVMYSTGPNGRLAEGPEC
jgi:hypothetical protein